MSEVPTGKGPVTTRRLSLTREANRTEVTRGDSFARQRGPVSDPKGNQEWGDALFVIIVRYQRIEVGRGSKNTVRT